MQRLLALVGACQEKFDPSKAVFQQCNGVQRSFVGRLSRHGVQPEIATSKVAQMADLECLA